MELTTTAVENKLRHFILENYLFTDDQSELENGDSFLTAGILDSMGILELVGYLDDDFEVKVSTGEMTPENLDSIDNLVAFIAKKTQCN